MYYIRHTIIIKMVKKNKRNLIIGISLILLIVTFFVLSQRGFFDQKPLALEGLNTQIGQCSGGWTSFSIDKVTINSDKSRIRVFGVAKGSECLSITLTPSQLNSALSGQGVQATKTVTGSVRLTEYTKTFPIDKTGYTFYSIENKNLGFVAPFFCTINKCKSEASSLTVGTYRSGWAKTDCNCIYYGTSGISGDFSSARSYGNFKVDFNIDGKTATLTREQQSVSMGNHRVEWTGNLMNLDQIYVPQYDARLIGSQWDLVQDGAEGKVNTAIESFAKCLTGSSVNLWGDPLGLSGFILDTFLGEGIFTACKTTYQTSFNNIVASKLSTYKTNMATLIYDAKTDTNALYVSLKASPYPAFILDLDASDVGIIALEGKPKITNCIPNQIDLKSGQTKNVQFSVKNDVSVSGVEFYSSINCNQGVTGFVPNFNIDGLQTKQITAELHPANPNQADMSISCTLRVTDSKSGNYDTCGFSGSIKYESGIVCEPYTFSCDSAFQNLLQCSADGKNKVVYKTCEYGCQITSQGAECRQEAPPVTPLSSCKSCDAFAMSKIFGNVFESKQCKPTLLALPPQTYTTCFLSFIKFGLIPIVFIFGTLFLAQLLGSFKAIKKNKLVIWLLSLIIAGILAYLTFILFWMGLIALILVIIIRSVIPTIRR